MLKTSRISYRFILFISIKNLDGLMQKPFGFLVRAFIRLKAVISFVEFAC